MNRRERLSKSRRTSIRSKLQRFKKRKLSLRRNSSTLSSKRMNRRLNRLRRLST